MRMLVRRRLTLMPSDEAASSPMSRALSARARKPAKSPTAARAMAGRTRWCMVAAETEPSRKNMMLKTFCASVEIVR